MSTTAHRCLANKTFNNNMYKNAYIVRMNPLVRKISINLKIKRKTKTTIEVDLFLFENELISKDTIQSFVTSNTKECNYNF